MAKSRRKNDKAQKKNSFGEEIISWIKTIIGAVIVVMVINGVAVASFVVPTGSMENTVMTGDFLFVNKYAYGPTTPQIIPFVNVPLPFWRIPAPFTKDPEPGDVIVFIYPGDRDDVEPDDFVYYLKRCVAAAGDTVALRKNALFLNGKKIDLPEHGKIFEGEYIDFGDKMKTFPPGLGFTKSDYGPIRVPKEGDKIDINIENWKQWEVFIKREGNDITVNGGKIYINGEQSNTYTVEKNYCFGVGDNRDNSLDSRYWGFVPYENVVGTPMVVYWSWDTDIPFSSIFDKIGSTRLSRIGTIID